MVLTFECVDNILRCHHSNKTCLPLVTYDAIWLTAFSEMNLEFWLKPLKGWNGQTRVFWLALDQDLSLLKLASLPVVLGEFGCDVTTQRVGRICHRTRFQASSDHSDSENWTGDKVGFTKQISSQALTLSGRDDWPSGSKGPHLKPINHALPDSFTQSGH